jgi:hypothetical protein
VKDVKKFIDVTLYNSELDIKKRLQTDMFDWSVYMTETCRNKKRSAGRFFHAITALAAIENYKRSGYVLVEEYIVSEDDR